MKYSLSFCYLILIPTFVYADHELDIYAFNDLFVFDTFAGPKPVRRQFNVVVLNDTMDLQLAGKMKTEIDANVDGYAHWGHYLLVFMMNQIEIYDLQNPFKPQLVRSFQLANQGRLSGHKGIRREEDGFTFLSYRSAARLTFSPDIEDWKIDDLPQQPVFSRDELTTAAFPWHRFHDTFLIKATKLFKYQVEWDIGEVSAHAKQHIKLLRKRHRDSNQVASELVLGELLETFGE